MNLWNIKNLNAPAITTYNPETADVDIHTLRAITAQALNIFKNQNKLAREAALLSRLIYLSKLRLRSDKGLKAMEKTNHALLHYLRMNIPHLVETFHELIPQKYTRVTYLPSLNMLQYILVRLQGLAKLMVRIMESSKAAAHVLGVRVGIGHIWTDAFVCFSVVSRIFCLTRDLANFCCTFYGQLLPFTNKLKSVVKNWLPAEYCLPDDLKAWLNVDWLDQVKVVRVVKKPKVKMPSIFEIMDSDSEVEFCGEYIEIDDDIQFIDEFVEVDDDDSLILVEENTPNILSTEKTGKHKLNQQTAHDIICLSDTSDLVSKATSPYNKGTVGMEEDIGSLLQQNKTLTPKRQEKNISVLKEDKNNVLITNYKTTNQANKSTSKLNIVEEKEGRKDLTRLPIKSARRKRHKINNSTASAEDVVCQKGVLDLPAHVGEGMKEDMEDVVQKPTTIRNMGKNKAKRGKLSKSKQTESAETLIATIETLRDLQRFERNFEKIKNKYKSSFKGIDKLQSHMLHTLLKKSIKKAKKQQDESKVNVCIKKAKKALMLSIR